VGVELGGWDLFGWSTGCVYVCGCARVDWRGGMGCVYECVCGLGCVGEGLSFMIAGFWYWKGGVFGWMFCVMFVRTGLGVGGIGFGVRYWGLLEGRY